MYKIFKMPERVRLVTPQQFAAGYPVMIDGVIYHREYVMVGRDGRNVWVRDPYADFQSASKLLEETMPETTAHSSHHAHDKERHYQLLQAAATIVSSGRYDFPQALEKAIALLALIEALP